MKKISILLISLMIVSVGFLSGCVEKYPIIEDTGTIVYVDLEGGFYGIIRDSNPILGLDPINLPREFQEDGLRVWFKVRLRPDIISFHMWGFMVEILEIEKLNAS
jgi:inhibitor of cysteine peptidase